MSEKKILKKGDVFEFTAVDMEAVESWRSEFEVFHISPPDMLVVGHRYLAIETRISTSGDSGCLLGSQTYWVTYVKLPPDAYEVCTDNIGSSAELPYRIVTKDHYKLHGVEVKRVGGMSLVWKNIEDE